MLPVSRLGFVCSTSMVWLVLAAAAPASSAPILLEYEDAYYEDRTRTLANRSTIEPGVFPTPTILQLPRFNPALGTLLSVDLDLSISIFGQMDTHCASPITCNTEASAFVRSGLRVVEAAASLGVDLGSNLEVSTSGSRSCSFTAFFADCSRQWIGRDSESRNLTFTGADMAGFIGTIPFGFISLGVPHMSATLSHSGFPDLTAGGPANVDGAGGLTFSGLGADVILALLEVSYELFLNDVFANHNAAYSDAHLYANELVTARVGYTYEPAVQAVPEPGIAALVSMALAAVGVRGRLGLRGGNASSRQRFRVNRR